MKLWLKIVVVFLFIAALFTSSMTFRRSDKSLKSDMENDGCIIQIDYFDFHHKTVRYLYHKHSDTTRPLLVLIHGAPGSSTDLLYYIKNKQLRHDYSILLVDRLGYGYSDYGHYSSIYEQTMMLIDLINHLVSKNQKAYVAGHSYGATIAGVIACNNPDFLAATVMMAPALDAKIEKYFWFGKLGTWKATRWLASGALKVAADEKYSHAKELKQLENLWSSITTPIMHIHGTKDNVVPFGNILFSKSKIDKKYLTIYEWQGVNHFFPFTQKDSLIKVVTHFFDFSTAIDPYLSPNTLTK